MGTFKKDEGKDRISDSRKYNVLKDPKIVDLANMVQRLVKMGMKLETAVNHVAEVYKTDAVTLERIMEFRKIKNP